jgi:hypothetical protein
MDVETFWLVTRFAFDGWVGMDNSHPNCDVVLITSSLAACEEYVRVRLNATDLARHRMESWAGCAHCEDRAVDGLCLDVGAETHAAFSARGGACRHADNKPIFGIWRVGSPRDVAAKAKMDRACEHDADDEC